MNRSTVGLAVFAISLSVVAGAVPAAVVTLQPDTGTFEERHDPSVNVSGQLLAGIMFAGATDKVHLDGLHVSFAARPGKPDERLCIRLASRDGVYTARWTTTLAADVTDMAMLPIVTTIEPKLKEYKADELVALASVGSDCNAAGRVYLPTLWGWDIGEETERQVTLFLNADVSDAIVAARLHDSDEFRKTQCRILSSNEMSTAFDTICTLPLESGDQPTELIVLRQNFSTRLEPLRYPLADPE